MKLIRRAILTGFVLCPLPLLAQTSTPATLPDAPATVINSFKTNFHATEISVEARPSIGIRRVPHIELSLNDAPSGDSLTSGFLGRTPKLSITPLEIAATENEVPASAEDDQPTFMRIAARNGWVDPKNERWNVYGQFTYISGWKQAFDAPYTNANGSINSLLPIAERSFTGTATAYLALRAWHGGELYFVPELISENPYSQLKGLGGAIQDFELQKGGNVTPTLYRSRLFLRQTFEFGGSDVTADSGPMQLGTTYKSRRLVLSAGNFSILDFLDKNAFDIDPRQGLFSLAFLTYTAYDFASDARGYSWGLVPELYWDNWAVRVGRITAPRDPNQLQIDWRLFKYYGDQIEIEHDHKLGDQEGKVRVLAYRNRENIGNFSNAIAAFEADPLKNATTCTSFNYGSNNADAPDLCWARASHVKQGIGAFAEQYVLKDIGVFARGMVSDGKSEVYAYTSTDRSIAAGVLAKGTLWKRRSDLAGGGYNVGTISKSHEQYLAMGGIDGFIGDGRLNPGSERAIDLFYSFNFRKSLWLAGDYQRITNPAFNVDRGPVNVWSLKIHGEF